MQDDNPHGGENEIPRPAPLERQHRAQNANAADHEKDRRQGGEHGQLVNRQGRLPTSWANSSVSRRKDRDHWAAAAVLVVHIPENQLSSANEWRCSLTSARRPILHARLASTCLLSGGSDISATMKWSSGIGGAAAS